MCKRPLIKRCDSQDKYGAPSQSDPKIVCETFFETACNTTDVVPAPGDEPLPVTFCDKIPRKICAPDNCRVVEGKNGCGTPGSLASINLTEYTPRSWSSLKICPSLYSHAETIRLVN